MKSEPRNIRSSSVIWIIFGTLLICGSLSSGHGSAPLTLRYELTFALALVGMAIIIWASVGLVRHKGDYDDWDKPEGKGFDDSTKETGNVDSTERRN